MNPRICRVKENPPHSYGDCIRACIETILDRDDVPHFFDGRPTEAAWRDLRFWLAEHKKFIAVFPTEDHAGLMKENNPDIPYILLHGTLRGDHAVVCKNGEKIHDPAWYRCGEMNPHSLGFYIIVIIGDLI